jgi:hypothetical protein
MEKIAVIRQALLQRAYRENPTRNALWLSRGRAHDRRSGNLRVTMVKIAAWHTAGAAYRIVAEHLGEFVHLALGWLTCLLACVVIKMLPWPGFVAILLDLLTAACIAIASAAISVGCYRAVLQNDVYYGGIPFSFGARELRYARFQTAIAALLLAPFGLLVLWMGETQWWRDALAFLWGGGFRPLGLLFVIGGLVAIVPLIVASTAAAARLLLALPAAAIDEPGRLLRDAWIYTGENARPLFFGWLACILLPIALWESLWLALDRALGALAAPLVELAGYGCYFFVLTLTAAFYAYVYAQLAEGEVVLESEADAAVSAE